MNNNKINKNKKITKKITRLILCLYKNDRYCFRELFINYDQIYSFLNPYLNK
ncbi:hypothetical protein [Candidatus Karelsulcia muelleri]